MRIRDEGRGLTTWICLDGMEDTMHVFTTVHMWGGRWMMRRGVWDCGGVVGGWKSQEDYSRWLGVRFLTWSVSNKSDGKRTRRGLACEMSK